MSLRRMVWFRVSTFSIALVLLVGGVAASGDPGKGAEGAARKAAGKPRPKITFPKPGATVCGTTLVSGLDRNRRTAAKRERAKWSFRPSSSPGFTKMPKSLPAVDSWAVRPVANLFDSSSVPAGQVTVRLALTRGKRTGKATRNFISEPAPVNGQIVSQAEDAARVATTMVTPVAAGQNNIKVDDVTGLVAGRSIVIDSDTNLDDDAPVNREIAVIQNVGTAGPSGTGITLAGPLLKSHTETASVYQLGISGLSAPDVLDNGTIETYVWDFGDGSKATGPEVAHTFTGSSVVNLTTTDDKGCETETPVTYELPQETPTTPLQPSEFCDPLTLKVNRSFQGKSSDEWPKDDRQGVKGGKTPLGRIHNDALAVGYAFEVQATVLGKPDKCTEGQLIKTTRTIELKDGTVREWRNPATGGVGGKFHRDGYESPFSFKKHGAGAISWFDIPRVYNEGERFGGGFHARRNPIVKAKVESEVLAWVSGGEAPIPHGEPGEGGPGETVFQRFKVCAAWKLGAVIDTYSKLAAGGADAALPTPAQDNTGNSGWVRAVKIGGC